MENIPGPELLLLECIRIDTATGEQLLRNLLLIYGSPALTKTRLVPEVGINTLVKMYRLVTQGLGQVGLGSIQV